MVGGQLDLNVNHLSLNILLRNYSQSISEAFVTNAKEVFNPTFLPSHCLVAVLGQRGRHKPRITLFVI